MINFVVLQFEDDSDEENAVVSQVLDELGVEMAGSVRENFNKHTHQHRWHPVLLYRPVTRLWVCVCCAPAGRCAIHSSWCWSQGTSFRGGCHRCRSGTRHEGAWRLRKRQKLAAMFQRTFHSTFAVTPIASLMLTQVRSLRASQGSDRTMRMKELCSHLH